MTKLIADFNKQGLTGYDAFKAICTNNSGVTTFSLTEIKAIIKSQISSCPTSLKNIKFMENKKEGVLEVYEDGENLTYSIQEMEYYTLEDTEAGEDALLLNPVHALNTKK